MIISFIVSDNSTEMLTVSKSCPFPEAAAHNCAHNFRRGNQGSEQPPAAGRKDHQQGGNDAEDPFQNRFLFHCLICDRCAEQGAQNAVHQKQEKQKQADAVDSTWVYLLHHTLRCRFQPVVEYQAHQREAEHAAQADDSINIQQQPPIVPKPQAEKMKSGIADDVLHNKTGCFFTGFMA